MKKIMGIILTLAMLTTLVGCAESRVQENMTAETSPSASQSSPESAIEKPEETPKEIPESDKTNQTTVPNEASKAEAKKLTQEEKTVYVNEYIKMDPFTFQSWSDTETIESFRFGTFYGNNATNDSKFDPQQFAVENTPNYEIPQEIFEKYIQQYFSVTSEYLRTSRFYDADKGIYTGFLAGGGMPVEYEVVSVQTLDSIEEITYVAKSEDGESKVTIGVDHNSEPFKFAYVKQE